MADFFISYTAVDKGWAEWIAYVLEEEGYSTLIQAWDFGPGSNFIHEMQNAASQSQRTVLVLSPEYLASQYASAEWMAAFHDDPQGIARKLVPVQVRRCKPTGLLAPIVQIWLEGQDEVTARWLLVEGVKPAVRPSKRPTFPGSLAPPFPGSKAATSPSPVPGNGRRSPKPSKKVAYVAVVLALFIIAVSIVFFYVSQPGCKVTADTPFEEKRKCE